jgi:glycosyltransferase involved in cell wall biosynthesis
MKTILMLAFYFPPYSESTGRLRTLSFARHLRESGWRPVVVTARPETYIAIDPASLNEIPPDVQVIRAAGFDVARTMSFRGAYPRWLAIPDRWASWAIGAVFSGLKAVRQTKPDVIWSTFPVPSALLAGMILHRLTGIPHVIDLRDPLVYEAWPVDRLQRAVYEWVEKRAVESASAVVTTTPGARSLYLERYSKLPASKFQIVPNGLDEVAGNHHVTGAESGMADGPVLLLHSGLMDLPDRDPTSFFAALQALRSVGALPQRGLRVLLRATGREPQLRAIVERFGLGKIVDLAPPLPRNEALRELGTASALLLFQGRDCNRQIPAKAYEYLASGKPIIGLMDPAGDTHALVAMEWGVPYHADMSDAEAIARMLRQFLSDLESGRAYVPPAALQERNSRRYHAATLAKLLDAIVQALPTPQQA